MAQLAANFSNLRQSRGERQGQTTMPTDPPPGLIPVPMKGAILVAALLTWPS